MFGQRGSSIASPLPRYSDMPPWGDKQNLYEGLATQQKIDYAIWISVLGWKKWVLKAKYLMVLVGPSSTCYEERNDM